MKNVRDNIRFWLSGVGTAIVGVCLARGIGPHLAGNLRWIAVLGGQFLALTGVFLICVGVRQRLRRSEARPTNERE